MRLFGVVVLASSVALGVMVSERTLDVERGEDRKRTRWKSATKSVYEDAFLLLRLVCLFPEGGEGKLL